MQMGTLFFHTCNFTAMNTVGKFHQQLYNLNLWVQCSSHVILLKYLFSLLVEGSNVQLFFTNLRNVYSEKHIHFSSFTLLIKIKIPCNLINQINILCTLVSMFLFILSLLYVYQANFSKTKIFFVFCYLTGYIFKKALNFQKFVRKIFLKA